MTFQKGEEQQDSHLWSSHSLVGEWNTLSTNELLELYEVAKGIDKGNQ